MSEFAWTPTLIDQLRRWSAEGQQVRWIAGELGIGFKEVKAARRKYSAPCWREGQGFRAVGTREAARREFVHLGDLT